MRAWRDLLWGQAGVAAAEFALVLPLLVVMLFGFWEYGRFVEGSHAVSKAVRDAVRYGARQPWADFDCAAGTTTAETAIKDQAVEYLGQWGADTTDVTVSVACFSSGTGVTGIYEGLSDGAPILTVAIDVPYQTLFGGIGGALGLNLRASAESAVMGI